MPDPTTDFRVTVDDLAKRSLARVADLDRRQEQVVKWEREVAAKRAEIEAETKALAERLALVLEGEANLAAKIKAATGGLADLASARAAADKARADFEERSAKLRFVVNG